MSLPKQNQLEKAIRNGDVLQARTAIQVELALKDTKSPVPKALEHASDAAKSFPGLFVPDDGCLPSLPETEWNSAYFRKIRAALISNFSREKLELAERVILYLREQGNPDFQVRPEKETDSGTPFPDKNPLPAILLGAAIGGGTGLVVGLIAGITLKATICGGILGGIAGAIASRTKNNR